MKYTNCKECPCLNTDYESGSWCNLRYETDLEWLRKSDKVIVEDTPEMRAHQRDFDLAFISRNCGLVKIVTKVGEQVAEHVGGLGD